MELPLLDADGSEFGVAAPERAGVPAIGRLFEMIPVLVFWNVMVGVADSVSSYGIPMSQSDSSSRRYLQSRYRKV
jgi:hypothetical protein